MVLLAIATNMKMSFPPLYHYCSTTLVILLLVSFLNDSHLCFADPTDGFTEVPLTNGNFDIQKPYDKPLNERYSFENGIRRFWVFNNDKPFKTGSPTRPRTEIRLQGHDYSSGVWQFEGQVYVPKGTSGVTVMQVFGAVNKATAFQLRVYNGNFMSYNSKLVATNIYDRWLRINVIHDVRKGQVTVFVDGQQKLIVNDDGVTEHYFKCGVYAAPDGSSNYMESRWRSIKVYKK